MKNDSRSCGAEKIEAGNSLDPQQSQGCRAAEKKGGRKAAARVVSAEASTLYTWAGTCIGVIFRVRKITTREVPSSCRIITM